MKRDRRTDQTPGRGRGLPVRGGRRPRGWCLGRSEGDERVGADELPRPHIIAQVTPTEDGAEEPQPVRVLAPELRDDGERLLLGEEALLRGDVCPPSCTLTAGCACRLRYQSVCGPQPAQMTASPVAVLSRSTIATVWCGCPVLRPTWVNITNVRPAAGPALCW